ncbi:hypothetical protein [Streptacidiphilus melanogenes]|uniref:hypothetical protein n=1 Tax=Streptacidiphilus melanogenes TaxID=411235 RepID=UPI0005A71D7B|nr:hypothetical protein [Streptacidiphilus melanogenes]
MASISFPLVWRGDGQVLVPASVLSRMLREIDDQLAGWPAQGADTSTVEAVRTLLGEVADQIDVDCIAVASELEDRITDDAGGGAGADEGDAGD